MTVRPKYLLPKQLDKRLPIGFAPVKPRAELVAPHEKQALINTWWRNLPNGAPHPEAVIIWRYSTCDVMDSHESQRYVMVLTWDFFEFHRTSEHLVPDYIYLYEDSVISYTGLSPRWTP